MIRFGMGLMEIVEQLTRGFMKATGKQPGNLEKLKIQQEAIQRLKEMNKVVDMEGRVMDTTKPIVGGTQEGAALKSGIMKTMGARPRQVLSEDEIRQKLLKNNEEGLASMKSKLDDPEKKAMGGRIGLKSGSYLYKKFKDLGLGKLLTSDKVAGVTMGEEGIAELLRLLSNRGMFADGRRAGFMAGGMGRRGFLKLLGLTGAGIAGAKTGLMSLAKKSEPVVEAVKETAQEVPSYFFSLVNKIRSLGDDTLATQDKTIAKKYKDYVMEEDFAGNIEIIKKGDDVAGNKIEDVYMSYKVDEVPLKKGGSRKVEEYEEYTARPDMEGKMKDVEPGVPNSVVEEAMSEAPSIKKASGGISRMLGE